MRLPYHWAWGRAQRHHLLLRPLRQEGRRQGSPRSGLIVDRWLDAYQVLSAVHDELANGDLAGLRRIMDKRDLHVEVQGDDIVVTLPDTSYVVRYYRATAFPQQLLTKSHSGREDQGARSRKPSFIPAPGGPPTPKRVSWGGLCRTVSLSIIGFGRHPLH